MLIRYSFNKSRLRFHSKKSCSIKSLVTKRLKLTSSCTKSFNLNYSFITKNFSEIKKSQNDLDIDIIDTPEDFKEFLEYLLKRENYTWEDFYQMLLNNYRRNTTLVMRLRGIKADKSNVDLCNKFKSALFPEEAEKYHFSTKEVKNLDEVTGIGVQNINTLIFNYLSMKSIHSFLRQKYFNKEKLPKSQEELNEMMKSCDNEEHKFMSKKILIGIFKKMGTTEEKWRQETVNKYTKKFFQLKRTYEF